MLTRSLIMTLALPLLPTASLWERESPPDTKCAAAPSSDAEPALAREIIRNDYGLAQRDMTRLCDGQVITGTLPTSDHFQMTLIGMVRLDATAAQFAQYAETVERLVATEHVRQLGKLDVSAMEHALRAYPILSDDLDEIPTCKIGDCDVKLPRDVILELSQLDVSAQVGREATSVIKDWLQRYLSGYRSEGNTVLVQYGDKSRPQSLRVGFERLMADAQVFAYRAPLLHDYFSGIIDSLPAGMSEDFVWSVEEFGMRPLTTVTHSVVYGDASVHEGDFWVGMKLLYASHYLTASLRLMRVIEDPTAGQPTSYLICVDRLLFDAKVGGIKRAMAKRRLRSYLADRLEAIRNSLGAPGLVVASGTAER